MTAGVYRIRNRITGMAYIGSSVDIARRIKAHVGRLRIGTHDNPRLQADWTNQGGDLFSFGLLEEISSDEQALADAESRWLQLLATRGSLYNGRLHGRGGRYDRNKQRPRWCNSGCGALATRRFIGSDGLYRGVYCDKDLVRAIERYERPKRRRLQPTPPGSEPDA